MNRLYLVALIVTAGISSAAAQTAQKVPATL